MPDPTVRELMRSGAVTGAPPPPLDELLTIMGEHASAFIVIDNGVAVGSVRRWRRPAPGRRRARRFSGPECAACPSARRS
jgi:hypothetical protein